MPDSNVALEGLEFEVSSNFESALDSVEKLTAALGNLDKLIGKVGRSLSSITQAANGIKNVAESISKAVDSVGVGTSAAKVTSQTLDNVLSDVHEQAGQVIEKALNHDDIVQDAYEKVKQGVDIDDAIRYAQSSINLINSFGHPVYDVDFTPIEESSEKALSALENFTRKTEEEASRFNKAFSETTDFDKEKDLDDAIDDITGSIKDIPSLDDILNTDSAVIKTRELQERIDELKKSLEDKDLSNWMDDKEIRSTVLEIQRLQSQLDKLNGSSENKKVISGTAALNAVTRAFGSTLKTITNLSHKAGAALNNAFRMGRTAIGAAGAAIQQFTRLLTPAAALAKTSAKLIAAPFQNLAKKLHESANGFSKLGESIGHVLKYRAISLVISLVSKAMSEGLQNLYIWATLTGNRFQQTMDGIATSAQYVTNSFAAMASPILNSLAPALDFLADKIVYVMNLLNQFFAAITGRGTYTRAIKSAASFADANSKIGKALKGANDEFKKFLLGIDELNVVNDSKSGGSGTDVPDYGGMFEEVPIDQNISDFTEKIKDAIANGEWEAAGRLLGDKVNEIFDGIDWAAKGEQLGTGLQHVVDMLYGFLDETKFDAIGTDIAEFVNGAISAIDTERWGATFIKIYTSFLDIIIGFIQGMENDKIAGAVGGFLDGAITEAQSWLKEKPWHDLGAKIGDFILDLAENISEKLDEHKFGEIGIALAELINGIFDNPERYENLGSTLIQIITVASDNLLSFCENLNWDNVGIALKSAFSGAVQTAYDYVHEIDFPYYAGRIVDGLNEAVSNTDSKWTQLGGLLGDLLGGAVKFIDKVLYEFHWDQLALDFADGANGLATHLSAKLENLHFDESGRKLGNALNQMIQKIKWTELGGTMADLFNGVLDFIYNAIKEFDFDKNGPLIKAGIEKFINDIKWDELKETLKKLFKATLDIIFTVADLIDWHDLGVTIGVLLGDAIDYVFEHADEIIQDGIEFIQGLIEGIGEEKVLGALALVAGNVVAALVGPMILGALGTALAMLFSGPVGIGALVVAGILAVGAGALDKIYDIIKDIPWDDIGETIGNLVGKLIGNIATDLASGKLIAELGAGLIGLLGGAVELLFGTLGGLFEGIGKALQENCKIAGLNIIGGLIEGLGEKIAGIGEWLREHIFTPFMDAVKKLFGIRSPSTVMAEIGGDIVTGLLNGIIEFFTDIGGWIREHVYDPFVNGFKSLFGIGNDNPSTVMEEQGENLSKGTKQGVEKGWKVIPEFLSRGVESIRKTLDEGWRGVQKDAETDWNDIKTEVTTKSDEAFNESSESFDNLRESIDITTKNIRDDVEEKFKKIKGHVTDKSNDADVNGEKSFDALAINIDTNSGNSETAVDEAFEAIKNKINDTTGEAEKNNNEKFDSIGTKVEKVTGKAQKDVDSAFEEIRKTIVSESGTAENTNNSKFNSIGTKINSVTSNANTDVTNAFGNIEKEITGKSGDAETNNNNSFNSIGETINRVTGNAKRDTDTNFDSIYNKVKNTTENANNDGSTAFNNLGTTIKSVSTEVDGAVNTSFNTIATKISSVGSTISTTIKNITSSIKDLWNTAKEKLDKVIGRAKDAAEATSNASGGGGGSYGSGGKFASGGVPEYGSYFYAGEAGSGPELVTTVGGRTNVLNQAQITQSLANANTGIINAIMAAAQQVIRSQEENAKSGDVYIDGRKVTDQVTKSQHRNSRMYGTVTAYT